MAARENKNAKHYVDNKEFFNQMVIWKKEWIEAEDAGQEPPPITEYLGGCFLKIAERLCFRPNFINYTYHDDFISDGYENCILYAKNFNPEKSNNPFAYFTQIIYFAFLRRIAKEKKTQSLKHKIIENSGVMEDYGKLVDIDNQDHIEKHLNYLKNFYNE